MNNTVKRTLSGICFLAIVIAGLLVNKYLYAALITFMMVTMLYEFYRMTMGELFPRTRALTRALAIVLGCCSFLTLFFVLAFRLEIRLVGVSAILLLVLMISTLMVKDKADFKLFSFLYTGLLYIAAPLTLSSFVVLDQAGNFDGRPMLAFFIIIWASDVGAYCVGMLLGKYSKSVSPKKTWAGFWGGLAFAVLAGLILVWTGLWTYPWYHAIILSVIMHVAGVFGDLFESQWKRVCEIKDSGNIIPGHGGMMDRFDSALFAIPAGVIYLVIIGLL